MSLRLRIFISMILLVFTATLLVLGSTYYQYRTESDQYNTYRQDRKETQLTKQINYIVSKFDLSNNYEKWENFKIDFDEITKIHNVEYSIFNLEGKPLFYSYLPLEIISNNYSLDEDFCKMLVSLEGGKITKENTTDVGKFQSSYTVLKDEFGKNYAILFFPYFQDVSFAESELNVFLTTLYQIYFIMLVVAIVLAYFTRYSKGTILNPNKYIFAENVNISAYLFMSVIVALFMGLTVSAEEIIRDVTIGVGDTGVKAGVIGEIGCFYPLSETEKRILRGSAVALTKQDVQSRFIQDLPTHRLTKF